MEGFGYRVALSKIDVVDELRRKKKVGGKIKKV